MPFCVLAYPTYCRSKTSPSFFPFNVFLAELYVIKSGHLSKSSFLSIALFLRTRILQHAYLAYFCFNQNLYCFALSRSLVVGNEDFQHAKDLVNIARQCKVINVVAFLLSHSLYIYEALLKSKLMKKQLFYWVFVLKKEQKV